MNNILAFWVNGVPVTRLTRRGICTCVKYNFCGLSKTQATDLAKFANPEFEKTYIVFGNLAEDIHFWHNFFCCVTFSDFMSYLYCCSRRLLIYCVVMGFTV